MTGTINESHQFFVGWDVGAWHCGRSSTSQDAIVVLNRSGDVCGNPWRGNLRSTINTSKGAKEFLSALLTFCTLKHEGDLVSATIAIDAPLAFPESLVRLITKGKAADCVSDEFAENEYLFRFTERQLRHAIVNPLSAINDRIGSQATKAMHLISQLNLRHIETGVWSDGCRLTAIETYPSLCRERLNQDRDPNLSNREADICDARVCAEIAHHFQFRRETLQPPPVESPKDEGWIWAPKP